jgi:hypothetical protein
MDLSGSARTGLQATPSRTLVVVILAVSAITLLTVVLNIISFMVIYFSLPVNYNNRTETIVNLSISLTSVPFSLLGAVAGQVSSSLVIGVEKQYRALFLFLIFMSTRLIVATIVVTITMEDSISFLISYVGKISNVATLWIYFVLAIAAPTFVALVCGGIRMKQLKKVLYPEEEPHVELDEELEDEESS